MNTCSYASSHTHVHTCTHIQTQTQTQTHTHTHTTYVYIYLDHGRGFDTSICRTGGSRKASFRSTCSSQPSKQSSGKSMATRPLSLCAPSTNLKKMVFSGILRSSSSRPPNGEIFSAFQYVASLCKIVPFGGFAIFSMQTDNTCNGSTVPSGPARENKRNVRATTD